MAKKKASKPTIHQEIRLEHLIAGLTRSLHDDQFDTDSDSLKKFVTGEADNVSYKKNQSDINLAVTVTIQDADAQNHGIYFKFEYDLGDPVKLLPPEDKRTYSTLTSRTLPAKESLFDFFRDLKDYIGSIGLFRVDSHNPVTKRANVFYSIKVEKAKVTSDLMEKVLTEFVTYVSNYVHNQSKMLEGTSFRK